MRIGIDARFYGSVGKGLGRYTEKLIRELEKQDTGNEYVIFLCPDNFEEYLPASPRFRKRLVRPRWYSLAEQFVFPILLWRERLDLMHFPHFNVPLLYRRPFVFTLHDLILFHYPTQKASTRGNIFYWLKFAAYRLVLSSALRRARTVITVSDFTRRDICRNYPRAGKKIVVTKEAAEQWCYLGDRETERQLFARLGLSGKGADGTLSHDIIEPYVLYVGNAYPHKNLEVLLEAAELLPAKHFVLVGKADFFYQRLKRKADARGLSNVIFADYVTDQELGSLYHGAASYVFPSLYEGFGLPPLEAMQYGTPVLAAETSSLPEVLGNAALYFDPRDAEALVGLIRRIESEPALLEELRLRGYRQAALHTWSEMAEATQDVYRRSRADTKTEKWTRIPTNHPGR